jgi:hypothetical protein
MIAAFQITVICMKHAFFLVMALVLGGCTVTPMMTSDHVEAFESKYPYGKILMADGSAQASFIQWNEEYAVTARHVGKLDTTAFVCDANCDLQFVRHRAVEPYAAWRDARDDESFTNMGLNANGRTVVSTGNNLNLPVTFGGAVGLPYRTSTVKVIPGMSGGPVYGDDGKVVGMAIASFMGEHGRDSIYVPYSVILEQWHHFKK